MCLHVYIMHVHGSIYENWFTTKTKRCYLPLPCIRYITSTWHDLWKLIKQQICEYEDKLSQQSTQGMYIIIQLTIPLLPGYFSQSVHHLRMGEITNKLLQKLSIYTSLLSTTPIMWPHRVTQDDHMRRSEERSFRMMAKISTVWSLFYGGEFGWLDLPGLCIVFSS